MTNPLDDKIEAKENAFAALDRLYDENGECLHRLAMEEPPITAEQLQELYDDEGLEQLIRDEFLKAYKNAYEEELTSIIIHPDIAKLIEDYNNKNALQKSLQKINWGFKDCRDNFRNWRGHMRGEEWDFWEILSGEAAGYE
jgi:hypothetical protein